MTGVQTCALPISLIHASSTLTHSFICSAKSISPIFHCRFPSGRCIFNFAKSISLRFRLILLSKSILRFRVLHFTHDFAHLHCKIDFASDFAFSISSDYIAKLIPQTISHLISPVYVAKSISPTSFFFSSNYVAKSISHPISPDNVCKIDFTDFAFQIGRAHV